ncbi:MAG: CoA ligase [Parcubacteria group bacterium Athens0416_74]|nr:MAG: CoA ligase [Parcubacteria group bacterium Athens0416_74]
MMERSDIAALYNQILDEFVVHPPEKPEDYWIRMTSGTTTGRPFLTIWQKKSAAAWPHAAGMRRFIVAYGLLATRMSNVLSFRNNPENEGALVLPLDAGALNPSVERLLDDFAPDSFYAIPSFATRISDHMSEQSRSSVHTLGFSGEPISKTLRDLFLSRFPKARQVITFATSETGVITGFPCDHLSPNQYHPREGVVIEVDEPDERGIGYLLISKDLLFGKRMERYRIGDMARIVPETCPCGQALTFEVFGRAGYDYIKVAGAILRREEFDRVASECAVLFDDYYAEAEAVVIDGKLKGKIVLTVYRANGVASVEEIAKEFSARVYLTASQTLEQLAEQEVFLPLTVIVSAMPLVRDGKAKKLSLRT